MTKTRVGIFGYGNLGRGVELACRQNDDLELVALFTRRDPATVKPLTEGVPVPQKQPTPERRPMNKYFAALVAVAEALLRAVKGAEGRPNKELKKWTERIEALTRDIMN